MHKGNSATHCTTWYCTYTIFPLCHVTMLLLYYTVLYSLHHQLRILWVSRLGLQNGWAHFPWGRCCWWAIPSPKPPHKAMPQASCLVRPRRTMTSQCLVVRKVKKIPWEWTTGCRWTLQMVTFWPVTRGNYIIGCNSNECNVKRCHRHLQQHVFGIILPDPTCSNSQGFSESIDILSLGPPKTAEQIKETKIHFN